MSIKEIAELCENSVPATAFTVRCLDHDGLIIRRSWSAREREPKRWRVTSNPERKLIHKLNRARRREIDRIANGKVSCDLPAEVPPPPEPVQPTVQVEAPAKRRIVVKRKPTNGRSAVEAVSQPVRAAP